MQVYTATGRWLVPPQLAVWIPAGTPRWTDILSDTEVWSILWDGEASRSVSGRRASSARSRSA